MFNSNKKFKQGLINFKGLLNPDKYKGTFPIIYRSSWERDVVLFLDKSPSCVSWASESNIVRYVSPIDGKQHRYYLDFKATFKDRHGKLHTYLIEVKPYRQTQEPKPSKRKKQSTYLTEVKTYKTNTAKWNAAIKFAQSKGYKFIILTERELYKNSQK